LSKELDWLLSRGLTPHTIKEAGLTYADGKIRFPWRWDGKEVGYQVRTIEPKGFKFNDGFSRDMVYCPSGYLPNGYDVWVCEGPMDGLTLFQLGYPAVAIPSATLFTGVARIPCRSIYLALDNDEPGELACKAIAAMGTPHKLFRVKYDGKDPNECVQKNGGKFPHEIVPYLVGGIKHIKEIHLNGNVSNATVVGFENGMPPWNQGDLVVLYGQEKSGKSSTMLGLLARSGTVPTLFEEYEMLPERVKDWFQKLGGTDDAPLYITTEFSEFQYHDLLARIHSAVSQLGVRLVVIDHIHFLASGKDNIVNLLANISQKLKMLAIQYKITIVVIAHETDGRVRDCRMIAANADHILHLERLNNSIMIEGRHRYYPKGNYTLPMTFAGDKK
jgi:AAA domain/Toprim-like